MPKLFPSCENLNYPVSSRTRLTTSRACFLTSVIAIYYSGLSRGNCSCPREQIQLQQMGETAGPSQPRKQASEIEYKLGKINDRWQHLLDTHGSQVKEPLSTYCRISAPSGHFHFSCKSHIPGSKSLSFLIPALVHVCLINVTFINSKIPVLSTNSVVFSFN